MLSKSQIFVSATMLIGVLVLTVVALTKKPVVTTFAECEAAGYAIMESYPRKCGTPSGQKFIEDIGNELVKIDLIRVSAPRPNSLVFTPLKITGEARGSFFKDKKFPVSITDETGKELGKGDANAPIDAKSDNLVPFTATITFSTSTTKTGTIILNNELFIPVKFGVTRKNANIH